MKQCGFSQGLHCQFSCCVILISHGLYCQFLIKFRSGQVSGNIDEFGKNISYYLRIGEIGENSDEFGENSSHYAIKIPQSTVVCIISRLMHPCCNTQFLISSVRFLVTLELCPFFPFLLFLSFLRFESDLFIHPTHC